MINSSFTKGILSRIAKKVIRKKTGYEIGLQIHDLNAQIENGVSKVCLNVELELPKEELMKILKDVKIL